MPNERMVSATAVAVWVTWTLATICVVVGCSIGLAHYNAEWARTTGVVVALAGVLFMGAAAVLSVRLIAERRTRRICCEIEAQGDRTVDAIGLAQRAAAIRQIRGDDS